MEHLIKTRKFCTDMDTSLHRYAQELCWSAAASDVWYVTIWHLRSEANDSSSASKLSMFSCHGTV